MYTLVEICALPEEGELVGKTLGYGIKKEDADRLHSVNYFDSDEAEFQVKQLNEQIVLNQYWPRVDDPEVQALLNDPNFEEVEYEDVKVPDYENSEVQYIMKPGPQIGRDEQGNPVYGPDEVKYDNVGQPTIDFLRSTIVYKTERHPKRTGVKSRIDRALYEVAKRRAGLVA